MKKNQEIAEVLYNIAELLELKGENTFKIRAYNKAARAVEGLWCGFGHCWQDRGISEDRTTGILR
jgi:hypothetical protein